LDGKQVTPEDRFYGLVTLLATAAPLAKGAGPLWAKGKTLPAALEMSRGTSMTPIQSYRVLRVLDDATSGTMDLSKFDRAKAAQSLAKSANMAIPSAVDAANRAFEMRIGKKPVTPLGGKPPPIEPGYGTQRGSQSGAPSGFWERVFAKSDSIREATKQSFDPLALHGFPLDKFDRVTATALQNLAYRYAEIGVETPRAIAQEIKKRILAPSEWNTAIVEATERAWMGFRATRPFDHIKRGPNSLSVSLEDLSQYANKDTGDLSIVPVFADGGRTGIVQDPITGASTLGIGSDIGVSRQYAGRIGWSTLAPGQGTRYRKGTSQSGGLGLIIGQQPESVLTGQGHHFYTVAYRAAVDSGTLSESTALSHINWTLRSFGVAPVNSIEGLASALDKVSARKRQGIVRLLGNRDFAGTHGLPTTSDAIRALVDPNLADRGGKVIGAVHIDSNPSDRINSSLPVPSHAYPHLQCGTGLGRTAPVSMWELFPDILERTINKGGHEGNAKRSVQFGQTSKATKISEGTWRRLTPGDQRAHGTGGFRTNDASDGSRSGGVSSRHSQIKKEIEVLEHNLRSSVGSWHRTKGKIR
jgi:hypothetical protein